ncbi:hypothetical protein EVAR_41548_1 [Eumeta japonica]|uniref:Uncharacterized protein n=1 Tax=Eumeta variegata TaxID=151549 RepID=A0A4C1X2D5_EUMVA|nr:hypothetical protein EVAR_41548_1 [Eumeta japonica]
MLSSNQEVLGSILPTDELARKECRLKLRPCNRKKPPEDEPEPEQEPESTPAPPPRDGGCRLKLPCPRKQKSCHEPENQPDE